MLELANCQGTYQLVGVIAMAAEEDQWGIVVTTKA